MCLCHNCCFLWNIFSAVTRLHSNESFTILKVQGLRQTRREGQSLSSGDKLKSLFLSFFPPLFSTTQQLQKDHRLVFGNFNILAKVPGFFFPMLEGKRLKIKKNSQLLVMSWRRKMKPFIQL